MIARHDEQQRGRGGGLKPLGKAVRPLVKPLLRGRPPLEAALLLDWHVAVGAELAALCEPVKLRRERRGAERVGALEVACLSWAALELQHRAPQMIERINTFLGVPAVHRLRIRQVARLTRAGTAAPPSEPRPLAAAILPGPSSGHEGLDQALARLVRTMRDRNQPR